MRQLPARGEYKHPITHDLKLYGLALKLNSPNLEVDTNSANIALCVGVVGKPQKQTGLGGRFVNTGSAGAEVNKNEAHLANTRVTNEKKLEEEVVFARVHRE
jgi:hypothetical protein